jgi:ABC-2 type transport system permease protein
MNLAGTGQLVRLVLRRDRLILPLWILLVTAFFSGTASSFSQAYPTPQAQHEFVENVVGNPAIVAVIGPVLGPGIGGLTAWRVGTAGSMIVALIAILAVVRHTRTEEVAGRQELARAAAVGRGAHLTAVLAVVGIGMLIMALLTGLALTAQHLPAAGAFALAFSLAAVGWVFAGVAALAAEICSTARAAVGVSVAVLALAIVLRMGADAGGGTGPTAWLVWLTPTGWMQQVLPFSEQRWWVFLVFLAVTAVLLGAAYRVRDRRDIREGLLPDRPGPAHAGRGLSSVFGLTWRQNRGLLVAVLVGYGLLGLLMGSAAPGAAQAGPQLGPFLAKLGVANGGEALVTLLIYVFAEILAAYAIMVTLRPRSDETGGLAFVLLATPASRTKWALSQFVIVVLGTTAAMLVLGVTIGLTYGLSSGDLAGQLPAAVGSALAKLPAVWVVAGVAALLFGLVPRLSVALSWAVFVIVLALEIGWEFGQVSDAVFAVSPFSWVYPLAGQAHLGPVLGLTAVAAALGVGGVLALQRRDVG